MFFRGSYVALITPFLPNGRIDWKTFEKLVERQVAAKTDGIVCCASTGEMLALSDAEKKKIAQGCIQIVSKKIQVLVATGYSDTRRTVQATALAQKLGADGCLVVTPFYNKPTQRGCIAHYKEVGNVGLPVIIYHNPGRAGVRLTEDTIAEMGLLPGIVGYKDSAHEIELIRKIKKMAPQLLIFSGDDDFAYSTLEAGGVGSISVISNFLPEGWKKMIHWALEGKWEKAKILADRFMPLCKALFYEPSPQGIKYLMSWIGKTHATLRLPLVEPLAVTKAQIRRAAMNILCPQFIDGANIPRTKSQTHR